MTKKQVAEANLNEVIEKIQALEFKKCLYSKVGGGK